MNFERVCEKIGLDENLWSQKLLSVVPGEAAEVLARLSKEDYENYGKVKAALLHIYCLSTEAFRQQLRQAKSGSELHTEFVYELKSNLEEWLKSVEMYVNRDNMLECIALEQFYRVLPEEVRLWLQDRLPEVDLEKAAQLAEEY